MTQFGKEFGRKYFSFNEKYVQLNHGSYGASPIPVQKERAKQLEKELEYPDAYRRFDFFPLQRESRQQVADLLDADENDVVFVNNATSAVNTVLRSFPLHKGDKIVYCSTIYGACHNTLRFLVQKIGIELIEVELNYPMSNDDIVAAYTKAIDDNTGVKLVFFDAVSSMPGCRLPWERLAHECRKRSVLSFVDGAHGIGLIPISLRTARPDFFTTNAHKWSFAPPSCAIMYVDKAHHRHIHTMPISHSYLPDNTKVSAEKESTWLSDRFEVYGTTDQTPQVAIQAAFEFRNKVCRGEEAIRNYTYKLAKDGAALVAKQLGTEILTGGPNDDIDTAMANVRIPVDSPELLSTARNEIEAYVYKNYNSFLPLIVHNGGLWCRLSAQIYNDIDDFQFAANALEDAVKVFHKNN